jgi:hypothetical protein
MPLPPPRHAPDGRRHHTLNRPRTEEAAPLDRRRTEEATRWNAAATRWIAAEPTTVASTPSSDCHNHQQPDTATNLTVLLHVVPSLILLSMQHLEYLMLTGCTVCKAAAPSPSPSSGLPCPV